MLGHASIQQTQRYLNVTDEELRKGLEVSWKNQGRPLRLASQALNAVSFLCQIVPNLSRRSRKGGSSGWIRTSNPPVNSRMLCR